MSEQLNLKLSVSQAVRPTEIQCLFTKFTLKKNLARSLEDSDSVFYLGINYTKNPTEKPWLKASARGVNKLNGLMKTKQALLRSEDFIPTKAHEKLWYKNWTTTKVLVFQLQSIQWSSVSRRTVQHNHKHCKQVSNFHRSLNTLFSNEQFHI